LKDYQRMVNDADGEMQQKEMELVQKIAKEVAAVVREIGEKDKYTLIVEKGQGGVLYGSPTIDITSRVVTAYNDSTKKKSSPSK
jgi:outer membrane protein